METIPNYLIQTQGNNFLFVNPRDVVYISPYNGRSVIYLKDESQLESKLSIDALEKKLTEPYFVRIHKSIILNQLYAKNFLNHSTNIVTLMNGEELAVQKEYRNRLFSRMLKI